MHSARANPHKVTRLLYEAVDRHVVSMKVIKVRPPRALQVVHPVTKHMPHYTTLTLQQFNSMSESLTTIL